ncbi:MFS transporter [Parasphingorhabdus flavimaris]|uniref:MFS transporter n=1 Tax=Parasphingorhabdus flavimaris TaxID=266812 RepID=A0ABX2N361_9SPHN|nr:MFS transporter [Parasphingorhabdus flavimaris]NVD28128.1 MFS transporter [Parasphingorhabdus flavimaris]|tara:strand:- start:19609 stop:20883 length:1275 start_codon:yes stop_codon:yes gene_type:complete
MADQQSNISRTTSPNVALGMLLLVYIFNFVDRQILAILAGPIQADLGLSDTQMGLLGGLAFALLYSTLAVPLAWVADKTSRSWVITVSLAVWSGFTALTGLAQGFWSIFLMRLGVGVGEAGGVAPSYALISDHFPSEKRARALAIYSLGIPLGSATGVIAGGYIAATVDWRLAFFVVGLSGLLIAPLFKYFVRDKAKVPAPAEQTVAPYSFMGTVHILARKRAFWLLAFGAASSSMLGYGIAFWLPSLLQRSFGLSLIDTSLFYGAILLFGGVAGVLGGGMIGDRLGKNNKAAYGLVPAAAFLLAVPLFAAGIMSGSATIAFILFLIPQALAYFWLGPVLSAVQHLVPAESRATASALFLLINNLIGIGGGIFFLGALSDSLTPIYGEDGLRYSMLYSLTFYVIAAALMALAARPLKKEWIAED